MARALTPITIANLSPAPGATKSRIRGCTGLRVVVFPSKKKSFIVRYRFRGLQRKLTLGPCLTERGVAEPASAPETGHAAVAGRRRAIAMPPRRCARPRAAAIRRPPSSASAKSSARPRATRCGRSAKNTCAAKVPGCARSASAGPTSNCSAPASWAGCRSPRSSAVSIRRVLDHIADHNGPARADRVLSAAKTLLNWHAGRTDFISPLGRGGRRTSTRERARERVLTDDELRRVWLAAEQDKGPFGPFVRFVLLTATRRGEAGWPAAQ